MVKKINHKSKNEIDIEEYFLKAISIFDIGKTLPLFCPR